MPCPQHLSICNMANERQVADDSIYIEKGGKIDVREYSFVIGYGWWVSIPVTLHAPVGCIRKLSWFSSAILVLVGAGKYGCSKKGELMAARRITQSSINWTALAERVPENQKGFFTAFKAKSDGYLRR